MMKLSFVGTGEQKEKTKQQKPKEVFFFIIVKKKINRTKGKRTYGI